METHVEFIAIAEVWQQIFRPLVGLRDQHPPWILFVHDPPHLLQKGVGFGQVLAIGALALLEIGDGVRSEAVYPHIQP
ncbi:MAG: hypothetical protein ACWGPS_09155, partial [Candidatus Promineifilaceae bacterium]